MSVNSPEVSARPKTCLSIYGSKGTADSSDPNLTVVKLPGNAGYITFRPISRSGPPAVDVNVPGITFDKIHFSEDFAYETSG